MHFSIRFFDKISGKWDGVKKKNNIEKHIKTDEFTTHGKQLEVSVSVARLLYMYKLYTRAY